MAFWTVPRKGDLKEPTITIGVNLSEKHHLSRQKVPEISMFQASVYTSVHEYSKTLLEKDSLENKLELHSNFYPLVGGFYLGNYNEFLVNITLFLMQR